MKVLVIGGTGTVGSAVSKELAAHHEVIVAGFNQGTHQVDISSDTSVNALFEKVGKVDAIVVTTGNVHFGSVLDMTPEQVNVGLQGKLLGQIRVALIGQHYLNEGGSITLTSGILTDEPIRLGSNATTANAGVEGFVRAAAVELRHGQRINVVSPTVLTESMPQYAPFFPGFEPVPAARVALAYRRSVDGVQTGKVFKVI